MSTIAVGVDGSEGAEVALRFALEEAKLRGAAVRAVHAWRFVPTSRYVDVGFQGLDVDVGTLQRAAEASLEANVAAVAGDGSGVEIEQRVVEGPAAGVLVDESRDADLLVVGSRGHGGFTGLLLGSVSQQVAQHATCPVVIVRPQA